MNLIKKGMKDFGAIAAREGLDIFKAKEKYLPMLLKGVDDENFKGMAECCFGIGYAEEKIRQRDEEPPKESTNYELPTMADYLPGKEKEN